MHRILPILLFLAFAILSPTLAQATTGKVKAELVSEHTAIIPGETLHLGLLQDIAPGWHTYWKNPGDSGLATTLQWELPAGFMASDILWPTPQRQPYGDLMNYGYSGQILLPVEITLPDNLPLGTDVTIKLRADWLVCADICIPEGADLSITLPVDNINDFTKYGPQFKSARAQQPQEFLDSQTASLQDNSLELRLTGAWDGFQSAQFFPDESLVIQNNAPQNVRVVGDELIITLIRDETTIEPLQKISGDLKVETRSGEQSYRFESDVKLHSPQSGEVTNLGLALLFAFLGGIILNLMPCVFPILSMKALALVHKSGAQRKHIVTGGFIYTLGVIASFWLVGGALLFLRAAGGEIGWGIQLQSPQFVGAMIMVLFVIGLLLGGITDIGQSLANLGDNLAHKRGHLGTFFTGALAVFVATPCTAPFMGGAIFYAFTQNWWVTILIMTVLGLGMALPYLILTLSPTAMKFLPRPGLWMKQFKEFLAFPMIAAAIWLLWVLAQQTDAMGILLMLFALWAISFALWIWQQSETTRSWKLFLRSIVLIFAAMSVFAISKIEPTEVIAKTTHDYESFTAERLEELRSLGRPVFVNMTAAWCITCLANERIALNTQETRDYFMTHDIAYLKGDWTNRDPKITSFLQSFGRNGVPLYVYYPGGDACPVVLPQLLTVDHLIKNLSQPPQTGDCS
ncbi:MAG TPA: protein-disulfide reductase DsbD family protein [Alphaproteobacteria bacterium]|nr:hypothetical protein [Rhodospirillaceae bacterium]HRJ12490.1 protein-disulfide reductase DsbD family protein [Alphaproteobacteria bacterium]